LTLVVPLLLDLERQAGVVDVPRIRVQRGGLLERLEGAGRVGAAQLELAVLVEGFGIGAVALVGWWRRRSAGTCAGARVRAGVRRRWLGRRGLDPRDA